MSQTTAPAAAKLSLLATVLAYFSSPADRNGLTAVGVSLITALAGAFALTGTARTSAIIVAIVVAAYGVLRIVLPDNAAVKGDVPVADTEQLVRDALTAFATRNPTAFAAILADLAKVAGDFTVTPAPTPVKPGGAAAVALLLMCGLAALCGQLTACTSGQTSAAFVAAESADTAALTALVAYEKLPTKNEATVQKLLADQAQVDTALAPAEAEVAAGQPVTNTAAITGAVAVLTADELAAGVSTTTGSN